MRVNLVVVIAIFAAGASAIALLSVPDVGERIAMLNRDGRDEAAVAVGNDAYRNGISGGPLLSSIVELNSRSGDPALAEKAIRDYLARHPDDQAMLQRAAEFFEYRQDLESLLDTLRHLTSIAADPATVSKLARLYRVYGRYDEERELLLGFRDMVLEPALVLRLGQLLVREKKFGEAELVLARAAEIASEEQRQIRIILFDAMVENGRFDAATGLASRWIGSGLKSDQTGLFVLSLARKGAQSQAAQLAAEAGKGAGKATDELAWNVGRQGGLDLARVVVDQWLDGSDRRTRLRATRLYVDLAISLGQTRTLLQELFSALASRDGDTRRQAVALARALYEHQGYGAIAGFRSLLSPDLLLLEPLFAASLARIEKNDIALRYFLAHAELGDLSADEAEQWEGLAEDAFSPDEVLAFLSDHRRNETLPAVLIPAMQRVARKSGRFDPSFDFWDPVQLGALGPAGRSEAFVQ